MNAPLPATTHVAFSTSALIAPAVGLCEVCWGGLRYTVGQGYESVWCPCCDADMLDELSEQW